MSQHRAVVDGVIRFGNGGSITVEGFRLDVAEPAPDREAVAQLLVTSLGLLMADEVELSVVGGRRGAPQGNAWRALGRLRRRGVRVGHPADWSS